MYYKIKGNSNLVRDKNTNAILSIDSIEYQNHKKIKEIKQNQDFRMEKIEHEVNTIKNDLNAIKDLLLEIKNGTK
jgi:hypothetical protein